MGKDVLQAVLARGGPEGGFGPSLDQGLGSSAWMPHCVGRYLDKLPSMYMELLVDVLRFRCVPGRLYPFRVEAAMDLPR